MSPSLLALCGFAAWTLLLVFALANYRVLLSFQSGKAINTFAADGSDVPDLGQRLTRAHLNCLEFLPIFGALVLAAAAAGKGSVTDPLALWVLAARVGQSLVHLASTAVPAVLTRASLFVVQLAICAWWTLQLVAGA